MFNSVFIKLLIDKNSQKTKKKGRPPGKRSQSEFDKKSEKKCSTSTKSRGSRGKSAKGAKKPQQSTTSKRTQVKGITTTKGKQKTGGVESRSGKNNIKRKATSSNIKAFDEKNTEPLKKRVKITQKNKIVK